ncbi:MAG: cation:dicarboxylate symporter family transporter, partial [Gammaproteobacteria bacterium]
MANLVEYIYPRSLRYLSDSLSRLVAGRLWAKVLIGMAAGIAVGVLMGPSAGLISPATATVAGNWLALPGQLFLLLVQMIVVPLVFASIIRGLAATEDPAQLKRLGLSVVGFFTVTTTIAILVGIALAGWIRPGDYIDSALIKATLGAEPVAPVAEAAAPRLDEIPQKILSLLPSNPLSSMVESQMLQVVIFAVIFGIALLMTTPERSRPLLEFLGSLQEVCMTVVRGAMLLAPIAVFGLMAQLAAKVGLEALLGMAVYVATVLLGLGVMLGLYLLIVFITSARSPRDFLARTRDLLLLAFSTSSSAAVMPLSIKTAEDKLEVRPSIAQFVIPIGATINMNGTALYQGVATIFLAQVYGIDISTAGIALLVVVAVGASIGSPATPGVGIVILAMVLGTVGIPPAGIALLMGVDRILDMSRTAVNVAGDLVACVAMELTLSTPLAIVALLAANAFFVAAEFALVKAR